MSGIPRIPRDMDPRRPRNRPEEERSGERARSYGQSAESPKQNNEDIEDFEDYTDEPVREGADTPTDKSGSTRTRKKRDLREFEELAGEPVLDEDEDEDQKNQS